MAIFIHEEQYAALKDTPAFQARIKNQEVKILSRNKPAEPRPGSPTIAPASGSAAKTLWNKVKDKWQAADSFVEAVRSRGVLATTKQMVGWDDADGKRVAPEIYDQRWQSCSQCVELKSVDNLQYCGACGCGKNKLAVISDANQPGRYTKLEFPALECPREKPGFSNYKKLSLVSVVITSLNEPPERLERTVRSLRETAYDCEIIIVDDHSDIPVKVRDPQVRVFRNPTRLGCAASRHFGAQQAHNRYLLFTDAHMIFDRFWLDAFRDACDQRPATTVYCGSCLTLNQNQPELNGHNAPYYGARLSLYEPEENQILEGKWIDPQPGDEYPISCMMGAIYFIDREYFFRLKGFSGLQMWGQDEPFLSLKILLSGGEIRLLKKVRAGHLFRFEGESAPYRTGDWYNLYNKIWMARTLLPAALAEKLISYLPPGPNFNAALNMARHMPVVAEREYYKTIFTRDLAEVCRQYSIALP